MFEKGYLRRYAKNGWKKKDGGDIAHKAEWIRIWNQASHMIAKGVICEPGSVEMKDSTAKSKEYAEADHQKRYRLIDPRNAAAANQ